MALKQSLTFAVLISCFASTAQSEICYFEVDDEIILQGPCIFEPLGGGDFLIKSSRTSPDYFAYVYLDGNKADGFWNETLGASHAHTTLGQLRRIGGCWINETVRVCAWKN